MTPCLKAFPWQG